MTDREDREGVYRSLKAHERELNVTLLTEEAAAVEIAIQLRRIGNSLEAIAETRTSIAVSLDRIAATFERAYPRLKHD
jgi:hypothetical protein